MSSSSTSLVAVANLVGDRRPPAMPGPPLFAPRTPLRQRLVHPRPSTARARCRPGGSQRAHTSTARPSTRSAATAADLRRTSSNLNRRSCCAWTISVCPGSMLPSVRRTGQSPQLSTWCPVPVAVGLARSRLAQLFRSVSTRSTILRVTGSPHRLGRVRSTATRSGPDVAHPHLGGVAGRTPPIDCRHPEVARHDGTS